MRPTVDFVLQEGKQTLLTQILPAIESSHYQGSIHVIGILLSYAALEYERGADIRVTDNAELRALFLDAADRVDDATLATRLKQAASIREASLRMSELDRVNDLLKCQFIELHEHVEACSADWARDFERRLLDFLASSLARRALPSIGA